MRILIVVVLLAALAIALAGLLDQAHQDRPVVLPPVQESQAPPVRVVPIVPATEGAEVAE